MVRYKIPNACFGVERMLLHCTQGFSCSAVRALLACSLACLAGMCCCFTQQQVSNSVRLRYPSLSTITGQCALNEYIRAHKGSWDAADIGAKAYASSAPEHCFSTQEVILSMLQHDEKFLQLLHQRSRDEGIDPLNLELAVADSYRSLAEREGGQYGRWPYNCPKCLRHKSLFGINMIIPNGYAKVDRIALEALYQYWGIMYVRF